MIICFRCGQCGHYSSECDATTKEVEHYHRGQTQRMKHGTGEQLLIAGVLQDDPDSASQLAGFSVKSSPHRP